MFLKVLRTLNIIPTKRWTHRLSSHFSIHALANYFNSNFQDFFFFNKDWNNCRSLMVVTLKSSSLGVVYSLYLAFYFKKIIPMNLSCKNYTFFLVRSAIIQKPKEKSYWVFVEGIGMMLTYKNGYQNTSSLQRSFQSWFIYLRLGHFGSGRLDTISVKLDKQHLLKIIVFIP